MEHFPHTVEGRGNAFHWVFRVFQTAAEGFHFVPNFKPFPPNPKFLHAGFHGEAEIALDVHDLVVAVHCDDDAAVVPHCLALELLKEVEDLELGATAVENVAEWLLWKLGVTRISWSKPLAYMVLMVLILFNLVVTLVVLLLGGRSIQWMLLLS